jgi:hypothetical protein
LHLGVEAHDGLGLESDVLSDAFDIVDARWVAPRCRQLM